MWDATALAKQGYALEKKREKSRIKKKLDTLAPVEQGKVHWGAMARWFNPVSHESSFDFTAPPDRIDESGRLRADTPGCKDAAPLLQPH